MMAQRVQDVAQDEVIDEKKILKEAKEREKEIKEEMKKAKEEAREKKKDSIAQSKPRIKHGKIYRESLRLINKGEEYEIEEAIRKIKETSKVKFDSTVELHVKIDKKIENIRGTVNFTGGVAKQKKVALADEKNVDKLVEDVKKGKVDFDILVAKPSVMPKLGQLAKILGPKGMMPNPKTGTVSEEPERVAEEFKSGKVEYKGDKGNVVHVSLGKVSFEDMKLKENYEIILSALPKGKILSVYLTSTMGPSVRVAP
jgi:large subunit ribosomal protein L1